MPTCPSGPLWSREVNGQTGEPWENHSGTDPEGGTEPFVRGVAVNITWVGDRVQRVLTEGGLHGPVYYPALCGGSHRYTMCMVSGNERSC